MKKYILVVLVLFIAVYIFGNAMVASISNSGSNFYCSTEVENDHYCVQLIDQLNQCDEENGRAMILYDDQSADDITDIRRDGDPTSTIYQADYFDHIDDSFIMMGHSRTDETGGDKPYNPFVWESRTDDAIYTFMSDEELDDSELEDLLTEGADDDWMYDAIDYLHSNTHNASLITPNYSDVCNAELYFLWLIKNIEANRDVLSGLKQALYRMNMTEGIGTSAWKNFIFSDGDALYLYKNGTADPPQNPDREIYYGDVFLLNVDQSAFAVTTDEIGIDFNNDMTEGYYQYLDEEVLNLELVVLPSDSQTPVIYSDFGNPNHLYRPEVSYLMTNGVNWRCFPVDYSGLYADDQIEETENYFENLYHWEGTQQTEIWNDMDDLDLLYTKGYKLDIDGIGGFGLLQYDLDGVHVFEDREIPLDSQYNRFWIPYFMHGSASVYDAFDDIIDDAVQIIGQYWTMWRKNTSSAWNVAIDPGKSLTCYYGKMYDVTLVTGHPTVMDYYDILGYEQMAEYIPPETEYYEYEEKLEYEAILIDTIVSNETIEEIAVFEGEECIGASVFQGYPVFIRAFTEELNRTNEPLEFRVYTGSRSEPDVEYRVFDEDFAYYRDEPMYPHENVITHICLGLNGEEMPVMSDNLIRTKQYPDPFNPETAIEYSIPEAGNVNIDIYNIKGQKVKSLISSEQAAGLHKVIWNGTDDSGRRSASGMYFYVLKYNEQVIREKMLMVK